MCDCVVDGCDPFNPKALRASRGCLWGLKIIVANVDDGAVTMALEDLVLKKNYACLGGVGSIHNLNADLDTLDVDSKQFRQTVTTSANVMLVRLKGGVHEMSKPVSVVLSTCGVFSLYAHLT